MINCVCIADEMVLVDSDDDEERKLLLSESPSLTNSPVITKELVKEESLLYSLTFSQITHEAGEKQFSNLWPAPGPSQELDFDLAIQSARNIYSGMFPQEEFLPRAPDPEEIVFGEEEEEDATAQAESESKDGVEVETGNDKTVEGDIEAGGDGKTDHSEDGDKQTPTEKDCDDIPN